ncbi:MAG: hypothetical protein AB7G11_16880 [Phycisphaerales bacterium]
MKLSLRHPPSGVSLAPTRASPRRPLATAAGILLVWLASPGCSTEQKVVSYHPFLANLPDAQTGFAPVGDRFAGVQDPNLAPSDDPAKMVVTNPDGSVTLVSASIRQLMSQVINCLKSDELEILHDQLVAEDTKREYRARGKDSFAFVEYLFRNRADVLELFTRMPMAENTPAVALHQAARNTFKLQLTGIATKGLYFSTLWVTHEKGTWKIMWIE